MEVIHSYNIATNWATKRCWTWVDGMFLLCNLADQLCFHSTSPSFNSICIAYLTCVTNSKLWQIFSLFPFILSLFTTWKVDCFCFMTFKWLFAEEWKRHIKTKCAERWIKWKIIEEHCREKKEVQNQIRNYPDLRGEKNMHTSTSLGWPVFSQMLPCE